ncbi:hypothetical protein [Enterococcus dongliensis]|uniref:hypothetical protein n=1 Tax=Enterococcus dongliensis TaxID=2559925 RepID=UPI00288FFF25|nr:hypothetical protein [Enterococcus dongliensis]MDT2669976.1 hypothetical protein [Enterococcus dongliensis]
MNKQEVIDKLKEYGAWCTECHDINEKKDRYVKSAKVRELLEQLDEPQAKKVIAHLAEKWHEDIGPVLWWNFPVEEPPYCGTPLDEHFPSYKTHFTQITMPDEIEEDPLYTVTINLDLNYHLALDEGDGDDEISTTLTTGHDVLGYRYFLTEKEIKSADENLWPFAVPAEKGEV